MPNWKTYESSVRLLSAIVAAHPGLKLNYDEVGRFYGGGTKYKSVWDRMTQINKHAKTLRDAVEADIDPLTVELNEAAVSNGKPKAKDMAARFGGDCTKSSLENRFRRIKTDAQLMNEALKKGIDPISLDIGGPDGAMPLRGGAGREIVRCFGTHCTISALKNHMVRDMLPNTRSIQACLSQGGDPKTVTMVEAVRDGKPGNEVARHYGCQLKGNALRAHFSRDITANVNALKDTIAAGQDPTNVVMIEGIQRGSAGKEIARCFGGGLKGHALSMHFTRQIRPITKLIFEALARGEDPLDTVSVGVEAPKSGKEIAKHFGSDTTSTAVYWQMKRHVHPGIQRFRECVEAGGDPKDLDLAPEVKLAGKGKKELRQCFGTDVTEIALKNQFWYPIKKNVEAINAARAAGTDCKDIVLPSLKGGASSKKLAGIMGSDVTPSGLKFQFTDRYKPIAKKQLEMEASGLDPRDVLDHVMSAQASREISKYFGSDSTGGGIGFQFRAIKADAKLARECYDSGGDPKSLNIGGKAIARHLNDGTTGVAIEHRFRPIKKEAEVMKAAIASNYGEGASGKAVSTYFERAKKDPQWNLANTIAENGNGGGSAKKGTPRARKTATPKGKKGASQADDDSEEMENTPSKKGLLNKVASGRVQKPSRASAKKNVNYAESDNEEDEEDTDMIKPEPEGFADIGSNSQASRSSNPYGNGHSNGNSNGYHGNGNGYNNYAVNNGHHSNLNGNEWSGGGAGGDADDEDYFHDMDDGDEA